MARERLLLHLVSVQLVLHLVTVQLVTQLVTGQDYSEDVLANSSVYYDYEPTADYYNYPVDDVNSGQTGPGTSEGGKNLIGDKASEANSNKVGDLQTNNNFVREEVLETNSDLFGETVPQTNNDLFSESILQANPFPISEAVPTNSNNLASEDVLETNDNQIGEVVPETNSDLASEQSAQQNSNAFAEENEIVTDFKTETAKLGPQNEPESVQETLKNVRAGENDQVPFQPAEVSRPDNLNDVINESGLLDYDSPVFSPAAQFVSEPEEPQEPVLPEKPVSEDDLCHIFAGKSNIVLDIAESAGNRFDQFTVPRELPVAGSPAGGDIRLVTLLV